MMTKYHMTMAGLFFSLFISGCGFQPPPSDVARYYRPGLDVEEIIRALDACHDKYPKNPRGPHSIEMNSAFKRMFCMEDTGYPPKDAGRTALKGCRNFTSPKLPVCVARGAYKKQ